MDFVAAGWCRAKNLRLNQAIKNLICGDLEIPLGVIWLGVARLKKTGLVYLLDMFGGWGGGGVVWFSVCEAPPDDWADGGSDWANGGNDVSFRYGDYGFSSTGI